MYKWCFLRGKDGKGHVGTPIYSGTGTFNFLKLHNLVMDHTAEREIQVDHKDRNGLNNLDDNLRICHESKNYCNRGKNSSNTSGYKGVSWHKLISKWEAYVHFNYKKIRLGAFDSKEEARDVRDEAVKRIHGEFAVTNDQL